MAALRCIRRWDMPGIHVYVLPGDIGTAARDALYFYWQSGFL